MHPISYLQAIILGLLQGVAEPFPISSLGHAVILPRLFGWDIHQNDDYFLTFLVATHLATAIVLFGIFIDDWRRIASGLLRSLRNREIAPDDVDARLGWLLVVGTIPAGILGLLLEHPLADALRLGSLGRRLPDPQRRAPARLRAAAPQRAGVRRGRRPEATSASRG